MANESTNNAKKEKFIGLLHELFQLNQPELDFGLYRIMHAKSDQIKAFIQNDLASEIDEAFADSGDDKIAELKASYEQARAQAVEFGIPDPDSNPKVKEAKEAYDAARDNGDDPSDIYDHLYRFFSRYYDKGDFLSRRYHVGENESRAAPYAVPYDGREVYLHWANKDQYYIKSSEYLSNFSFELQGAIEKERKRQGLTGQGALGFDDSSSNPGRVNFQLVDAAEGAHNNVKENQARFFIIHADKPVEVRPLISAEGEADGHELIINFEYRPDPEKLGQESGWQKKRLQEAETAILEAVKADEILKTFHDALAFLAPTEKDKSRTLLAKYLTTYTARNTMDYFIHKDLGGFLRRELDFYIKNEIMRLDDLSSDNISGVTHSLKKITALRSIGRQVVDFLAQLENFQKKLWLKKKFVKEANYCITLDRVPESFYDEIVANDRQWKEWQKLGFIQELKPSFEALQKQPFLMVDTGLFDEVFKDRLIAEIDCLDEKCDGLVIQAENYQGIRLAEKKYSKRVDFSCIDPPYNTGSDGFPYKDSLKRSSWYSMIYNRMEASAPMLSLSSITASFIDDNEVYYLGTIFDDILGENNQAACAPWKSEASGGKEKTGLRTGHEYILIYHNGDSSSISSTEVSTGQLNLNDERGSYRKGRELRKWGGTSDRRDRPNQWYALIAPDGSHVYPIKNDGTEGHWRWGKNNPEIRRSFSGEAVFHWEKCPYDSGILVDGQAERWVPFEKIRDVKKSVGWGTWLDSYGTNADATRQLKNLFGEKPFETPKPVNLYEWLFSLHSHDDGVFLDYFSGSGTTAQAVINLNRQDAGQRKYLLMEMGNYSQTVILPRIKKVVYSTDWKGGITESCDGVSHAFKYISLESYEDTLNNLTLPTDTSRSELLGMQAASDLRKTYMLDYFLDAETRNSSSLLNIEYFNDPTTYSLKVRKTGSDEQIWLNVDLTETFNWLLGLEVALLDKPRTYKAEFEREHDPDLPEDQHTRLKVKRFKEDEQGSHWFRVVEGSVRRTPESNANKEKVMVIWRKLTDDPEQDAAALEALLSKYHINQSDSEYDKIYINGPHGLSLSGQAKAKLLSLEETFMARMWEDTDGAMH